MAMVPIMNAPALLPRRSNRSAGLAGAAHLTVAVFTVALLTGAFLTAAAAPAPAPVITHEVQASFDLQEHTVAIRDRMMVPAGLDHLRLGPDLRIDAIVGLDSSRLDPQVVVSAAEDEDGPYQRLSTEAMGLQTNGGPLLLVYGGRFLESVKDVVFSRENVGNEITATIGEEGIYLSSASGWLAACPQTMAVFDVSLDTPAGFETVTDGRRAVHRTEGSRLHTRWVTEHPADGLSLIANRFVVHEDPIREGLTAYTFFLEDDAKLRGTYFERTRAYIRMYEEMIGPYPYAKFATVENWFPTGYGMPSWTLLGSQVLRLPFIPTTSFGHEIAHNWWGNSVFVDSAEGNWCEGLTSWCADYHYKELESAAAAREYRRTLLKDYAAYVKDPAKDFPLQDFLSRHSGATRAVGYGKSMMVFHMLDRMLGREAFLTALRRVAAEHQYRPARWSDFLAACAQSPRAQLEGFAEQWLRRTGAPFLRLEQVEFRPERVVFRIVQEEPPYALQVPVVLTTPDGPQEHVLELRTAAQDFVLPVAAVERIAVDPDCQLFRRLHPAEIEPTVRQVLAEDVIAVATADTVTALAAAARAFGSGFTERDDFPFSTGDDLPAAGGSAVMINPGAGLLRRLLPPELAVAGQTVVLQGKRHSLAATDLVFAAADPDRPGRTILVVVCRDPARLAALAGRLGHYGKYSWLLLPAGQGPVERGNWTAGASPLIAENH